MGNAGCQACVRAAPAVCSAAGEILKPYEHPDTNGASQEAPMHSGAQTHVLIIALDYPGTGNELTCTKDGDNMKELCRRSGVTDVVALYNNEGNFQRVTDAVAEIGSRCRAGDFFIFYYSGHGSQVPDKDGDEADGKDECLCLVTPEGKLDWDEFMTDDQLAALMQSNLDESVNLIIMCDCCHSGTICDFRSTDWGSIKAVGLSGCEDKQTSGDTGRGGIFTHSLLMGIADYNKEGQDDYSCGQLYNRTLDYDDQVFNSEQNITCAWSNMAGGAQNIAWPLIPDASYSSPWQ